MKSSEILNVPVIQKTIKECHSKFIKNYGSAIDKVMADRKLFSDIILTKMHRIALIFREEKVIDTIDISDLGFCKKLVLTKTGYNEYIEVATNGESIYIKGFSYTTGFDTDVEHSRSIIRNVNSDNFDWVNFSSKLLDYIHSVVYERKAASVTKFNSAFDSFDESEVNNIIKSSKIIKKDCKINK
jgi:hypothetical protein